MLRLSNYFDPRFCIFKFTFCQHLFAFSKSSNCHIAATVIFASIKIIFECNFCKLKLIGVSERIVCSIDCQRHLLNSLIILSYTLFFEIVYLINVNVKIVHLTLCGPNNSYFRRHISYDFLISDFHDLYHGTQKQD